MTTRVPTPVALAVDSSTPAVATDGSADCRFSSFDRQLDSERQGRHALLHDSLPTAGLLAVNLSMASLLVANLSMAGLPAADLLATNLSAASL